MLGGLPRLGRGLLDGALAAHPELVVVGVAQLSTLTAAARATHPHVVFVGLDGPELPSCCEGLLTEQPDLPLLALDLGSGRARLYRDGIAPVDRDALSPADVARAIRDAASTS